jgi:hypothetical protein
MKFNPSQNKQPGLSDRETVALREVAERATTKPLVCKRLQKLGLIEQSPGGWALTQQGHIRLMFQGAR